MRPDDPRHGTYAGVQAHYTSHEPMCEPCIAARRKYQKRLEVDHERGRRRMASPAMARKHIERLRSEGMPYKEIARLAGVSHRTIYRAAGVGGEDPERMHVTSLAKILAVAPRPIPSRGYVPRVGAIRRLQALIAAGHTFTSVADQLGMSRANLSTLIHGGRDRANRHIQAATWRRIADLYESLHMTPGPSALARRRAQQLGWLPALAWDDIDDPDERPKASADPRWRSKTELDVVVVERVIAGERIHMTRAERVEVVRRLRDVRGWSEERIEAHTGITQACNRHRYPRPDEEDAA